MADGIGNDAEDLRGFGELIDAVEGAELAGVDLAVGGALGVSGRGISEERAEGCGEHA